MPVVRELRPTEGDPMPVVRKAHRMADGAVSPKTKLAGLLPAIGTLVLAILDQVLDPNMDPTVKVAIVGVVNAILALAGAWVGKPGNVVVDETV